MVPRRIVANVVREQPVDERHFVSPQLFLIEVREQPLSVAPSVVVLRIDLEYLLVEGQFRCGVAQSCEEKPSMVPYLICLRRSLGERVG